MTPNTPNADVDINTQKCTYREWCVLRVDHVGACWSRAQVAPLKQHPAVSELLIWMPEWAAAGGFLLGALVADGLLSLGCLLVSVATIVWVVGNRAVIRRRNEQVLRAYEQNHELVAADAKLLENGTDQ